MRSSLKVPHAVFHGEQMAERQMEAHLGRIHEQTLDEVCCALLRARFHGFPPLTASAAELQTRKQVHKLRKQYDDLRTDNKRLTVEVQSVQNELTRLDVRAAADKTDDAFQTRSKLESVEKKCVWCGQGDACVQGGQLIVAALCYAACRVAACEARIDEADVVRARYEHMVERLRGELLAEEATVRDLQAVQSGVLHSPHRCSRLVSPHATIIADEMQILLGRLMTP